MKLRLTVLCALLLITSLVLTGCGGGIGTLLQIAGVRAIIPDRWTSAGGFVRIVAEIVTGNYLERVVAKITDKDSDVVTEIILTKTAEGQYEGTFEAAPDSTGDSTETYTAVVTATDTTGNTATSEPVVVEVPPVEGQ